MDSDYFNKNIGVNNSGDIDTKQIVRRMSNAWVYSNKTVDILTYPRDLKHVYYDRSVVTGTDDDGILLKKQNIAKDSMIHHVRIYLSTLSIFLLENGKHI